MPAMTPSFGQYANQLLARLSAEALDELHAELKPVALPLGTAICEAGFPAGYVYFVSDGIASVLQMTGNGSTAEVAVVGNEGVVGIEMFMGGKTAPRSVVVKSAAHALRLRTNVLDREFARGGELQHLLLRFSQVLITQIMQTAVCYRHHAIEQQLCRWLLMSLDRLESNELVMTQELIANMLGVRRESVNAAAGKLQKEGMIRYAHGRITVLNRIGIEQRTCECYAVVKKEYDRLLPALRIEDQAGAERTRLSGAGSVPILSW
jgi:CRP-like cAMP-binding protein